MRRALLWGVLCVSCSVAARGAMRRQWVRQLPVRKFAWSNTSRMRRDVGYPVAAQAGLLLVACEHNGALLALDLKRGAEQWRFYTGAPVRLAAAGDGKRIFLASDD